MSEVAVPAPRATPRRPAARAGAWRAAMLPFASWSGGFAALVLLAVVVVAVLAPWISPHDPLANHFDAAGQLRRLEPPSALHWLGTTYYGLEDDILTVPFRIERGRLALPEAPGLGVEVDLAKVRKYQQAASV